MLPSLRRHEEERATMLHSLGSLHALGYPIDWCGLMPGPRRFVRLPLYPWQRERFWHESEESRVSRLSAPAHPLLGFAQGGPRPAWEARLDLRLTPYLADHRVQHAAIMPAAAYLELAFAAGREAFGARRLRGPGRQARQSLLPRARPAATAPDHASTRIRGRFTSIRVRCTGDREWTVHLTRGPASPPGRGRRGLRSHPTRSAIAAPASSRTMRCYDYLRQIGLDYGPMFQGIERVWQGDRESLGLVLLPESLEHDCRRVRVSRRLCSTRAFRRSSRRTVTSTTATAGCTCPMRSSRSGSSAGRAVASGSTPACWRRRRVGRVSDVDIYNEDGQLAARLRGLRSHRVAGGREESLDDLLYAYQWRPQPRPAAEIAPATRTLVDLGGSKPASASRLAEQLRARGDACVIGPRRLEFRGLRPGRLPDRPRPAGRYAAADPGRRRARSTRPARAIVHLWNLDAAATDELSTAGLRAAQERGLLSVVWLVQAWDRVASDQSVAAVPGHPRCPVGRESARAGGDRPSSRDRAGPGDRRRISSAALQAGGSRSRSRRTAELVRSSTKSSVRGRRGRGRRGAAWSATSTATCRRRACRPRASAARPSPAPHTAWRRGGPGRSMALFSKDCSGEPPGPGEVEIEVVAAGLNFSDVMKALANVSRLARWPRAAGRRVQRPDHGCRSRASIDLHVGDEVLAVAGFAFGSHVVTQGRAGRDSSRQGSASRRPRRCRSRSLRRRTPWNTWAGSARERAS